MVNWVDYIVIGASGCELNVDQERIFTFKLPSDTVNEGSKRPIIAFHAIPDLDSENVGFRMEINNQVITDWSPMGKSKEGHWHVLYQDILIRGKKNKLKLAAKGDHGSVLVSDIVLWFHREI